MKVVSIRQSSNNIVETNKVFDQLADEEGERVVIANEASAKTKAKSAAAATKSAKKSKAKGRVEEKEAKYESESEMDEIEGDE